MLFANAHSMIPVVIRVGDQSESRFLLNEDRPLILSCEEQADGQLRVSAPHIAEP